MVRVNAPICYTLLDKGAGEKKKTPNPGVVYIPVAMRLAIRSTISTTYLPISLFFRYNDGHSDDSQPTCADLGTRGRGQSRQARLDVDTGPLEPLPDKKDWDTDTPYSRGAWVRENYLSTSGRRNPLRCPAWSGVRRVPSATRYLIYQHCAELPGNLGNSHDGDYCFSSPYCSAISLCSVPWRKDCAVY